MEPIVKLTPFPHDGKPWLLVWRNPDDRSPGKANHLRALNIMRYALGECVAMGAEPDECSDAHRWVPAMAGITCLRFCPDVMLDGASHVTSVLQHAEGAEGDEKFMYRCVCRQHFLHRGGMLMHEGSRTAWLVGGDCFCLALWYIHHTSFELCAVADPAVMLAVQRAVNPQMIKAEAEMGEMAPTDGATRCDWTHSRRSRRRSVHAHQLTARRVPHRCPQRAAYPASRTSHCCAAPERKMPPPPDDAPHGAQGCAKSSHTSSPPRRGRVPHAASAAAPLHLPPANASMCEGAHGTARRTPSRWPRWPRWPLPCALKVSCHSPASPSQRTRWWP